MTQYTTHKVILDETDNAEVRDALWQEIKAFCCYFLFFQQYSIR